MDREGPLTTDGLRHGVFVPPFNDFSDPRRLVELALAAEENGWDGFFLWDHVLRRPEESQAVADPWIALAAIAQSTRSVRIGTMVTPLARRRPQVVARQAVTVDRLSRGRMILGLGLGVDTSGELSRFGELTDPAARGDLLDEGADLVARLVAGERVEHRGRYFTADGVQLLPSAVQQPRLPIWLAARGSARASALSGRVLRRAARFDGLFLIDADLNDLARAQTVIAAAREASGSGDNSSFDLAVLAVPEIPSTEAVDLGATWRLLRFVPDMLTRDVEAQVARGPDR